MDVDARLEALEAENQRLRDRIAQLEGVGDDAFRAPAYWRLTGSEERVLGCLMVREIATKDAIMAALYRNEARDEPEIKIVDVFVCKVRKKLRPFGVEIQTVWGRGYCLSAATKSLIRDAMQQEPIL